MIKYHLVATIDVLRHGQKDSEGQLTGKGFYDSALKAIKIEHLEGDIHVYHSGNNRVMKTVSIIHNLIAKDMQYVHENDFQKDIDDHINGDDELFEINDHIAPELHFLYDKDVSGTYFPRWSKTLNKEESTQRMQDFLDLDTVSPEKGIVPSPKEMAQRLFSLILKQIYSVLDTPYESRENFINGTHEPVLMAGIFYMLNYFKVGKNDFVKHINGSVDFTEGFHIKIFQTRTNDFILQFVFRDYMIDFTVYEMQRFINE